MADRIEVTGIEVFAHHGVFEDERRAGQRFVIDLTLDVDLTHAGATDDLASTVDYGVLIGRVHDVVSSEQWNLIERVAQRVADVVLDDARVERVVVTVHKPEAPIEASFGDVAVSLTRSR